jgi:hypothetical protein
MLHTPSIVRINGVLPDLSTLGDKEKSERAAEVERTGMSTNASCSVFVSNNTTEDNQELFHLLIDAGEGVMVLVLLLYGIQAPMHQSRNLRPV